MNRLRTGIILATLAAAAVFVPGAARSAASDTTFVGTVGTNDAFVINLTDSNGTKVSHLDPGTYTITVHDNSQFHNFRLTGGTVNQATGVPFVGTVTWTVTLTDGMYVYQCDAHRTEMYDSFTVGTGVTPPPPPPTKLTAGVGPGRRIALRDATGARVTSLTAGRYAIAVSDRSKTDNFHLRGPGVNRATGVKFRGTARWTLTLSSGTYTYRSDKRKTLRGSFAVSPSP